MKNRLSCFIKDWNKEVVVNKEIGKLNNDKLFNFLSSQTTFDNFNSMIRFVERYFDFIDQLRYVNWVVFKNGDFVNTAPYINWVIRHKSEF